MKCRPSDRVAGLVALLIAFGANASVKHLVMANDAATNSEGEIEIQGWLDFGRPATADHGHDASLTNGMFWLGLTIGLLDSLELESFLVLEKKNFVALQPDPSTYPMNMPPLAEEQSGIMMWVTDVKWRPAEVGKWPIDIFLQFQLVHWFELYHPTQFRLTVGVSKNLGRFLLALNVNYWDSVVGVSLKENPVGVRWAWWEFDVGVTARLIEPDGWVPSVNFGVELWGFVPRVQGDTKFHVHNHLLHGGGMVLGPTLSLTRGRLWLTGHLGVPIFVPLFDPKTGVHIGQGPDLPLVGRIILGLNL